jgi:hypothetical protein
MATKESKQRNERRRWQRLRERWQADPAMQALRRQLKARQRYRQRHPFSEFPELALMHCWVKGIELGGRPPKARRCTKRLGSRLCWNWRMPGSNKCYRHQQAVEYRET